MNTYPMNGYMEPPGYVMPQSHLHLVDYRRMLSPQYYHTLAYQSRTLSYQHSSSNRDMISSEVQTEPLSASKKSNAAASCGGGGRVASIQTRRVHCWRGKITSSNLAIFPQSYDSLKIVRMSDCSVAPVLHLYAWFRALQCGVLFMSQAGFYPGSANGNHIFSWWPRWTILSGGRSQHPHWSGTTVLEIQQISSQISYKKPTTLYEGQL